MQNSQRSYWGDQGRLPHPLRRIRTLGTPHESYQRHQRVQGQRSNSGLHQHRFGRQGRETRLGDRPPDQNQTDQKDDHILYWRKLRVREILLHGTVLTRHLPTGHLSWEDQVWRSRDSSLLYSGGSRNHDRNRGFPDQIQRKWQLLGSENGRGRSWTWNYCET